MWSSAERELAAVLVCGEPGIGKSALIRKFESDASAHDTDAFVLHGNCHEREAVPYKTLDGIMDALSERLTRMPNADVAAVLPTRPSILAQLFPVMGRVPLVGSARRESIESDPLQARQRGIRALRDLFTRLALRYRTILSIDDLQWADDDGLLVLEELLRQPDAPPLLFLGTIRSHARPPAASSERLLRAVPGAQVIELDRLTASEALELASDLLAGGVDVHPLAQRIADEAGRHPLFVEELARQLKRSPNDANQARLDEAIGTRIDQLDPASRQVVELVVIATRPVPRATISSAAKLEGAQFRRSVATLRASNLVRTEGGDPGDTIEPYHDLVREAAVGRLDVQRKRDLHAALAATLEAGPSVNPEELATHWREAGDLKRAVTNAVKAGDEAARALAFDRASAWYQEALQMLPAGDSESRVVHAKLGAVLSSAGRGELAAYHFTAAADGATREERRELQRRTAEQLVRSGHFDRGIEASRRSLAEVGIKIPVTRWGAVFAFLTYDLLLRLRGLRFHERDAARVTSDSLIQLETCWSTGALLGTVGTVSGVVLVIRSLLFALRAGEPERIARSAATLASLIGLRGRPTWRRTEKLLLCASRLADRTGSRTARFYSVCGEGFALYYNGRFREAAERLRGAFDIIRDGPCELVYDRVPARLILLQSVAFLGGFRELGTLQREGLQDALARGDVLATANMRIGLANLAWLVEDRADLAEREATLGLEEWSKRGFHGEHYKAALALVHVRLYRGDFEGARAAAEQLWNQTKRSHLWSFETLRVRVLYLLGQSTLSLAELQPEGSRGLIDRAGESALRIARERSPWTTPFGRVLRAGVSHVRGDTHTAVEQLDAAAGEFARDGLRAFEAAVRERQASMKGTSEAATVLDDLWSSEGVVEPARFRNILVPTFGSRAGLPLRSPRVK